MSIKLMSAIFEAEFRDLQDEGGNVTKASTAKLVLLALADHANDEGEGAYPGLGKMETKTSLSRQAIINTYDALKFNGIIFLAGVSRRGTNNYTINTGAFPSAYDGSKAALLVNPVDGSSKPTLPALVNPVDPNHTITINETSPVFSAKDIQQSNAMVDAILSNGHPQDELTAINAFEQAFGLDRPWNWYPDAPSDKRKTWKDFREYVKKLYSVDPDCFTKYVTWSRQDYVKGSMTALGIKRNPQDFPDSWSAFSYSTKYHPETKTSVKRDENNIPVTY